MKQLTAVLAAALLAFTPGCGDGDSGTDGSLAVPDEIDELIDDWYDANMRGDGSVLDLYLPGAYHMVGDTRIAYDEIPDHLTDRTMEHEWITEPVLIAEQPDGQYVVVRGMHISGPYALGQSSALTFEITTRDDGTLGISESAWFIRN